MPNTIKVCPSCGSNKVASQPDPAYSYCESCSQRGPSGDFYRQVFPVSVYLSADEYAAVKRLAEAEERSMSSVLRRAVRAAIEKGSV